MHFESLFAIPNGHSESISSLAFNPNKLHSNLLASSSNDKYVSLYQVNPSYTSAERVWSYKYHLHGINQVKWNEDGNLLLSCSNDCSINVIDIEKRQLNRNFRCESIITSIDMNYSSNLLLCGTYDNMVMLYDMRSKNPVSKIISHSEPITSVSFSFDSTLMISTSYDGFCRVWDVFKSNCLKTIVLENSPSINTCRILPDENLALISSFNNQIQVINYVTEEEVRKYTGHMHNSYLVDMNYYYKEEDDQFYVISGSEDGKLYSWNMEDKENYQRFNHCEDHAYSKNDDIKMSEEGVVPLANNEGIDINENNNAYFNHNRSNDRTIINSFSINHNGLLAYGAIPDKTNTIHFLKTKS